MTKLQKRSDRLHSLKQAEQGLSLVNLWITANFTKLITQSRVNPWHFPV